MENDNHTLIINNFKIDKITKNGKKKHCQGVCLNCGKEQIVRYDTLITKRSIGCRYCSSWLRRKYSVGEVVETKDGTCTIVAEAPNGYCKVVFDGYYQEIIVYPSNLLKGAVKNPYKPAVHGNGFIGVGNYNSRNSKTAYETWVNMLKRCFDRDKNLSAYEGCTVSEHWLNFQNFARDYYLMLSNYNGKDAQLDKDLFSGSIVGKHYSKETCCMLPRSINTALQMVTDFKKQSDETYIAQVKTTRGIVRVYGKTYNDIVINYSKLKAEYLLHLTEQHKDILPTSTYKALFNRAYEINKGKFYA